jgi:choline-sulfatase
MRRRVLLPVSGVPAQVAVVLFLCALPLLSASFCGKTAAVRLNLLLVTLDTVRADHLGAYGYRAAETPFLDRLAREGLRFEHAVSAVPLTLPSHATILSGLTPPHHGLRNNGAGRFPTDRETLATRLSAAGYHTGAFVGAFVLDHRFGLDRGFEIYDDEIERDPSRDSGGLDAERPGSVVVDRALAWLAKTADDRDRPFFAWVHLYDAHAPYTPPEPYRSRHKDAPYDGEIASVDAQVGRLLEFLEKRGLSKRSVVAVIADHGEALGEHGELTHGLLLYEPTLRVPLIVKAPGVVAAGGVLVEPVSTADLTPTLEGLLGGKLAPAASAGSGAAAALDGRDLSASLHKGIEPAEVDLYAETEYPRIFGWSGLYALRRGRLKYVAAPRAELYDLSRDPGESANILAGEARRVDLDIRLARLQENARVPDAPTGPSAETVARLASLGYIGGKPPTAAPGSAEPRRLLDPKDMVRLFRQFEESNWAIQAGRFDAAKKMLEPLVQADPDNSVFRGLLAKACRRSGDLPRAITLYRRAAAAAPDDPEVRYNLAVTLQEAGRNIEALAAVAEAIRRDPARPEAHNALGISLSQSGKPEQALAEFDRAAELDPRDARAQNNRGNVLRQLGRFDEAERAYRRAIELAPRYAEAVNGLGTLEVARDRPAAAIPLFERALALAPEYHEARLNLGIAQETRGHTSAALAAYRAFVRESAGDPGFAEQRAIARRLIARLSGNEPGAKQSEGR